MTTISVNQIENILDEYWQKLKTKQHGFKNILFIGETGIGKTAVIQKWAQKHEGTQTFRYGPPLVPSDMKKNEFVHETIHSDKPLFTTEFSNFDLENTVFYYERINMCFTLEDLDTMTSYFSHREYTLINGEKRTAKNVVLLIADALPKYDGCTTRKELPQEILAFFDIYNVV